MADGKITKPSPATANLAGARDPSLNLQPLLVDSSGNLLVNVATGTIITSNPSVGVNGAAIPADSTQVGFKDGSGNLQPFSGTDSASGPNVHVTNFPATQPVSGTVTANQGTAGASPWPVSVSSSVAPVNSNGSYSEITNLTTAAQTFTKPANAVGFIMETDSSVNNVNIRWKIGATATTSSGMVMEPGRDTGYIPCSKDISVIAVSGSGQSVSVQWVLSS